MSKRKQALSEAVPTLCLREGCKRPAFSRGLCNPDYVTAARLVREGKTTWDALEKAGKSLPSKRGTTSWFLGD